MPELMARKIGRHSVLVESGQSKDHDLVQGVQLLSILNEDGDLQPEASAPLSNSETLNALRLMMLSRAVDDRAIKLNRMGRIGIYGPVHGQEATVVGSCWALEPQRDWMVPAYREQPALLHHGLPLANLFGGYMGRVVATRIPDGLKMLPRQVSVAAQLPHAAGLAWGLSLQNKDAAVMVYLGEGATSEGDFHEACNLAGVVHAPLVFVVQNNGWAISTPLDRQTAAASIASRATGYGFTGVLVDGNDLFAVYQAAAEAVSRARSGQGPTLLEARTYRMGFHNTTDNPREYRGSSEEEAARVRDPIVRIQRYLAARGVFDESLAAQWHDAINAEIDAAVEEVERLPVPSLDDVFANAYAEPSPRVRSQWEKMRRLMDSE